MPYPLHSPRSMKPRRTSTKAYGGIGVVRDRVAGLRMAHLVEGQWLKLKEKVCSEDTYGETLDEKWLKYEV